MYEAHSKYEEFIHPSYLKKKIDKGDSEVEEWYKVKLS